MATRKKGGEKQQKKPDQAKRGAETNDFTADELNEYIDSLREVHERAQADAAAARGDINAIYDKAAENLGIAKPAFKLLFSKILQEERWEKQANKMGTRERETLIRCADGYKGGGATDLPLGAWARERAEGIQVKAKTTKTAQD